MTIVVVKKSRSISIQKPSQGVPSQSKISGKLSINHDKLSLVKSKLETPKITQSRKPVKPDYVKKTLNFLNRSYPKLFNTRYRSKPLKLGILDDILLDMNNKFSTMKLGKFVETNFRENIKGALKFYTQCRNYHRNIKAGNSRYDLDGQPVDVITEKQEQHSQAMLKKIQADWEKKNNEPSR
jgi:sRNA-binding protein